MRPGVRGLRRIEETDVDRTFRVGLICAVVLLAGVSAASGLGRGVRRLSELNLTLAFVLLAFVVIAGPTVFLLNAFSENLGNYLSSLASLSFRTFAYAPPNDASWFGGWTIQYWAWWVSWSPFVGMFIARISRGRTVRQFVIGVLIVPTLFNLLWMTAFGNSAIWLDAHQAMGGMAQTATHVDALLFRFFDYFPGTTALSWLAIVLIAVFFVTSADSGAFVIDTIASRGAAGSPGAEWWRRPWLPWRSFPRCAPRRSNPHTAPAGGWPPPRRAGRARSLGVPSRTTRRCQAESSRPTATGYVPGGPVLGSSNRLPADSAASLITMVFSAVRS